MFTKLTQRFWDKVRKTESCWLWTAYINNRGYGKFNLNGNAEYSHRLSYIEAKGPIPKGLQIDHICRVRNCVKPDHLEAVTRKENILRGESIHAKNARKKKCLLGHKFVRVIYPSRQQRRCLICHRIKMRAYSAKKKEAELCTRL